MMLIEDGVNIFWFFIGGLFMLKSFEVGILNMLVYFGGNLVRFVSFIE